MKRAGCGHSSSTEYLAASVRVVGLLSVIWVFAGRDTQASDDFTFFEKHVRPILIARCLECHSSPDGENGLHVDSLAGLLRGGLRGPAIVPGQPEASLLIHALRHSEQLKMPQNEKLPTAEIATLATWIERGAPWPGSAGIPLQRSEDDPLAVEFTSEQRSFWAFRPPALPSLPGVNRPDWIQTPIDAFILARLEAAGLAPAPRADRWTLIRRVTFDLTGLPPTPEEVEAFVHDASPDAFAQVVDRLLASPRYGERWGRHWLDVARYGDSNGLDENLAFANAFRFRDYVIRAFNANKPYDRFVQEQIAGDLLIDAIADTNGDSPVGSEAPASHGAESFDALVATGFLCLGPKMLAEDDPEKLQMDIIDEQIDTIGRVFMGLTLGCARCHDHKFDPIPTSDYYSLAGIFKSTHTMDTFTVVAKWHERPLATHQAIAKRDAQQQRLAEIASKIESTREEAVAHLNEESAEGQVRSQKDLEPDPSKLEDRFPAEVQKELESLRNEQQRLRETMPQIPMAMAVEDGPVENVRIHIRGNYLTQGVEAPRRFPRILAGFDQPALPDDRSGRVELARWLTSPDHPLTSRVFVNRVWHWHFGAGLVRSPDNFGRLGERPTHPGLLDWLAVRFVESGWDIKWLHRIMLLSATYRQSAFGASQPVRKGDDDSPRPKAMAIDPGNELLWHMPRRRLEAEEIRDAILAVAGTLEATQGGSLLPTENRAYVTSTASVDPVMYDSPRRSVYLPVIRSSVYEVFEAFDFADPNVVNGARQSTTVAPQALFMMNSQFVSEQAAATAEKLLGELDDDRERLQRLWLAAYARVPREEELVESLAYLREYQRRWAAARPDDDAEVAMRAWQSLCRIVMGASEFIYIE